MASQVSQDQVEVNHKRKDTATNSDKEADTKKSKITAGMLFALRRRPNLHHTQEQQHLLPLTCLVFPTTALRFHPLCCSLLIPKWRAYGLEKAR